MRVRTCCSTPLTAAGFTVTEVLRPTRQVRRMNGKPDPIYAIEAARSVLAGQGLSVVKDTTTPVEVLRFLLAARTQVVVAVTRSATASPHCW